MDARAHAARSVENCAITRPARNTLANNLAAGLQGGGADGRHPVLEQAAVVAQLGHVGHLNEDSAFDQGHEMMAWLVTESNPGKHHAQRRAPGRSRTRLPCRDSRGDSKRLFHL